MTTEPKFVPNEAVSVTLSDETTAKVKLIDCVGYLIPDIMGNTENGEIRLVQTPWFEKPIPFDEAAAIEKIRTLRAQGKRSMVVVVAEGMTNPDGTPYAETLAKHIQAETGVETKFARFAHIVRGGKPVMKDRTLATAMGVKAVELLVEGKSNLVMCEIDSNIIPMDINFALITDRMYKNRLKDGDLDAFTPEQCGKMRTICHRRTEEIKSLYKIAQDASF